MGASTSSPERKILLLGKTGDGKSSAGNTILQKEVFISDASPNSTTNTSVRKDGIVHGRQLTVIDTPGLFDTNCDNDKAIKTEIIRAITECAPGIDAFVIVLKVDRFTKQETEIVKTIGEYCGKDIFKHAVVLFTHGNQLKGQTIDEFVQKSPNLQELVDKCGGRCHVIDNSFWKQCLLCPCSCGYKSNHFQVKNLLDTIDKMVQENGCYTNELILIAEQEIKKEMNNKNNDNLSSEERRERAKKNVLEKFLIRLAGVTTGTLVGAFLGIGVLVASVVALLKGLNYSIACKGVSLAIAAAETAGAVEAGVVLAAGTGIAAGVGIGTAALAGAVGGGITGYNAVENVDSVLEAVKNSAKPNYENSKRVVEKAEQLSLNVHKKCTLTRSQSKKKQIDL